MENNPKKTKRWRPWRYSLRTLAILVTLLCAYLACWWPTSLHGPRDVRRRYHLEVYGFLSAEAAAPLVVTTDEYYRDSGGLYIGRRFYFWFFGYIVKLPFERNDGVMPMGPRFYDWPALSP